MKNKKIYRRLSKQFQKQMDKKHELDSRHDWKVTKRKLKRQWIDGADVTLEKLWAR